MLVTRNPDSWRLVFVPISVTFETHLAEDFFQAIAFGLAEIFRVRLPATPGHTAVQYADHCQQMAEALAKSGRQTLVVIDGIDEALGDDFHTWWFPRNPGNKLKLILSARWKGDDEDSSGWIRRLGWDRNVKVRTRELPLISEDGVQEALIKLGAPTDTLASRPEIASRIYTLSQGEPLVLRYYIEDIWQAGDDGAHLTIEDLEKMRPGFDSFFRRSLRDQQKLWERSGRAIEREKVDAVLAVLACAHGKLRDVDLIALLDEASVAVKGGRLSEHLEPISRFIIGFERAERKRPVTS